MLKRRSITITIATLCLFAVGIAPRVAEKSVGATLSERLSSITGVFKRDESNSQANRTTTRGSSQRPAPSGYGRTRQQRRTAANSSPKQRTSSQKKNGLSSLLPESLFGKKKPAQNVTNNRQQQSRQQQANSQNQNRRNTSQVAQQKQATQNTREKRQLATDLPPIVEGRKAAIAVKTRKSPRIDRGDELQDAGLDYYYRY